MRQHRFFFMRGLAAAALIACALCPTAVRANPVAVVTDAQGRAALQGVVPARDLALLAEIDADARVQLEDKARLVVLYYNSGEEFAMHGPALVQFKSAAPEALLGNPPEKLEGRNKGDSGMRINPRRVTQAGVVLREPPGTMKLVLLGLSNTRTLETRPEFRWSALGPGVSYEYELSDDAGQILYETKTTANALLLPESVQLKPDAQYTWDVSARLSSGTTYRGIGEFSTTTPELRGQVDRARPGATAEVSEQIAFALWLEQMKLKDEARRYWRMAHAKRPQDPQLKKLANE